MASTNRGQIAIVPETTFGVTPTDPEFQKLRFTSSGLQYTKNTTESSELDPSRMLTDIIETSASSSGNVDFELSPGSYDSLIEASLGGTFTTAIDVAATVASISSNELTATGEFADAVEGQWMLLTGWSNTGNNGWKQITDVSGAPNSVTLANVVDEADTASGTVKGQSITNGVIERSFSVEEAYLDVLMYRLFKGMRTSSMNLSLSTGSIITGSFNFMGTESVVEDQSGGGDPPWLGSGSRAAVNAKEVLNSTANVGDIIIDGSVSTACFQSLDITVDNTLREVACLGSKFPGAINYGRQTVNGSFSKLFIDWTTYEKMLNHEDVSLSFGVYNSGGGVHVYLPRVKLSSDGVNLSGGTDSDVQESVDFSAIKSTDGTHQIRIDVAS